MEQCIRQGRQISETKQSAQLKERLDSLKNRYNLLGSKVRLELHFMHGKSYFHLLVFVLAALSCGHIGRCGKRLTLTKRNEVVLVYMHFAVTLFYLISFIHPLF